ncbi:MAG: hypothetical protein WCV56_06235 [Candidatus Omnitrophota bacterium]
MKKVLAVMMVMVMVFGLAAEVMATEASGPAMDAARNTGKYSKDVVTGSVNTVGKTTKGLGETLWSPFAAVGRWFRGKAKPHEVVTDPINKGGKTVHDTAVNTGKTVQGKM